jgi:hypothetical protein
MLARDEPDAVIGVLLPAAGNLGSVREHAALPFERARALLAWSDRDQLHPDLE